MEYNHYQIGSGTLAGIAVTFVVGIVLTIVLQRKQAVPVWRSVWIGLSLVSDVSVLLITRAPSGAGGTYACEIDGSPFDWVRGNQATANVAMFIPVAVALPLAARSTQWYASSFVALVAFPVLIEAVQATVPLGRACDGMDVLHNWFGIAFGCLVGWAGTRIASSTVTPAGAGLPR